MLPLVTVAARVPFRQPSMVCVFRCTTWSGRGSVAFARRHVVVAPSVSALDPGRCAAVGPDRDGGAGQSHVGSGPDGRTLVPLEPLTTQPWTSCSLRGPRSFGSRWTSATFLVRQRGASLSCPCGPDEAPAARFRAPRSRSALGRAAHMTPAWFGERTRTPRAGPFPRRGRLR